MVLSAPARADGGIPFVERYISPYQVIVYGPPAPHIAGLTVDISFLISQPPADTIITDANIVLNATSSDGSHAAYSFPATQALATKPGFYAANVRLPAGRWQFEANLRRGSWSGQVPFSLQIVAPPHKSHFPYWTVAIWGAVALVLIEGVSLAVRASRPANDARPDADPKP